MKPKLNRRHLFGSLVALIALSPIARIGLMRMKDNLLNPIAEPHVRNIDGWLLDSRDLKTGSAK